MFSVGVAMETAKAAINNGFKASEWFVASGSLRFVSTVFFLTGWLYIKSGDCEVTIFSDIEKLYRSMRCYTAAMIHIAHTLNDI